MLDLTVLDLTRLDWRVLELTARINAGQRSRSHAERRHPQCFAGQRVFRSGFATACEGGVLSMLSVSRIALPSSPAETLAMQCARPPLREPWCLAAFTHSSPQAALRPTESSGEVLAFMQNGLSIGLPTAAFWGLWWPEPLPKPRPFSMARLSERLLGLGAGSVAHFSHRAGGLRCAAAEEVVRTDPVRATERESTFEFGARVRCRWLWYRGRR